MPDWALPQESDPCSALGWPTSWLKLRTRHSRDHGTDRSWQLSRDQGSPAIANLAITATTWQRGAPAHQFKLLGSTFIASEAPIFWKSSSSLPLCPPSRVIRPLLPHFLPSCSLPSLRSRRASSLRLSTMFPDPHPMLSRYIIPPFFSDILSYSSHLPSHYSFSSSMLLSLVSSLCSTQLSG